MGNGEPVIWLTFFTLASGIVIGGGAYLYFLRRRQNREIAAHVLLGEGAEARNGGVPDGALPELVSVFLFALAMMALLALGYVTR